MKKIFSLFMAALFSMTMLAGNKIYFKASQDFWNWLDGGVQSATAIYAWDGEGHIADWPGIRMTRVEGEQFMWVAEIGENFENAVFVRVNAEGDFTEKGLKTKDLVIPTDGKNLYTLTAESVDWSNPDLWEKGIQEGEWSVFVPQTPAKFYITGILGAWNPDAIASTADSYTVKNVPAGHHAMKVTVNGTWDTAKGLDQISEFRLNNELMRRRLTESARRRGALYRNMIRNNILSSDGFPDILDEIKQRVLEYKDDGKGLKK